MVVWPGLIEVRQAAAARRWWPPVATIGRVVVAAQLRRSTKGDSSGSGTEPLGIPRGRRGAAHRAQQCGLRSASGASARDFH